ncbi:Hypothetical_protein [Hexamita inflata]|uniref:Hypothetical_protein n=1 Tax=Hexamita inflata TaxID=28002 RepID=A0AA86TX34_9EUKA|nr:Hypothetical protein HINF_LOCUS19276 [Hexamita inflata]
MEISFLSLLGLLLSLQLYLFFCWAGRDACFRTSSMFQTYIYLILTFIIQPVQTKVKWDIQAFVIFCTLKSSGKPLVSQTQETNQTQSSNSSKCKTQEQTQVEISSAAQLRDPSQDSNHLRSP